MKKSLGIILLAIILLSNLHADTHAFILENDFLTGTDRHYTNGMFYTWMGENEAITLAQLMFTPEDIENAEKNVNDLPYAGHIGLTWSLFSTGSNHFHELGFSVGSVGPISKAKETQTKVHEIRGITIPEGWDTQMENHPTAGITYQFGLKTRKIKLSYSDFDWTSNIRFDYGNFYTGAIIGTVVRFGSYLPKNFQTTGSFIGGHESSMLNMASARGFAWSVSLGMFVNSIHKFYVIDEAQEYNVEHIDYTVGEYASFNIYYNKFEFAIHLKSIYINEVKVTPETLVQEYGAFVIRWKFN